MDFPQYSTPTKDELTELLKLMNTPLFLKEKRKQSTQPGPSHRNTSPHDFVAPRKKHTIRPQNLATTPDYSSPNRFGPLANQAPTTEGNDVAVVTKPQRQVTRKPEAPPIVIRNKENWLAISKHLKERRIQFQKACNTKDGISIFTSSEEDHRTLATELTTQKIPYHTFRLRSEKTLKVVIRGIIQQISTDEVKADLEQQNYALLNITRLTGRDGRPAPLIAMELEQRYRSIYQLTGCCGLTVSIEPKHQRKGIQQCHRCQLYGHTQPNCHADYRCMKCAGAHSTHLCTKPTTTPAKCTNCSGEHTSAYIDCPQNPNRKNEPQQQPARHQPPRQQPPRQQPPRQQPPRQQPPQPQHQQQGRPTTYSGAVKHDASRQQTTDTSTFGNILGEMLTTLLQANPNRQQIAKFIELSTALYRAYTAN